MQRITVDLLSEDWEKLVELARNDGFRNVNDYARKIIEDKVRLEYRKLLS